MYDNQCENCCFAKAAEKNVIPHHKDYILCTYQKEFYMRNSTWTNALMFYIASTPFFFIVFCIYAHCRCPIIQSAIFFAVSFYFSV